VVRDLLPPLSCDLKTAEPIPLPLRGIGMILSRNSLYHRENGLRKSN